MAEFAVAAVRAVVRVVAKLLQETLQLQGARGLDLERAASGATSDEELPELRLNICMVSEVFVQILATGVGTLAFIWATVVLLGGFSTSLHKADFWVITGIVFIEAAKIVGVNSNTEANFFAKVPPAFLELGAEHFSRWGQRRPLTGNASFRHIMQYIMQSLGSAKDFISFMALLSLLLLLLPLVAGSTCIGLSIFRLVIISRHKYGGNGAADGASNPNVLSALIFFYGLVLAQVGLFLISLCIQLYRLVLADEVCSEYQFSDKDKSVIDIYMNRTSTACIKRGVLNTINRNLVSFALDLLQSENTQDNLTGVLALHTLTSNGAQAHKERALAQMHSSPDSIARMLVLLSAKSAIDEGSKVKLAQIVSELASNLKLRDVDRATESISSLIDPYATKISTPVKGGVNNGHQTNIDAVANHQQGIEQPLIIHGLLILAKLAGNPDNCTIIYSNKSLFSRIIAPIGNKLYRLCYDDTAIEITAKLLQVLKRLVKGTYQINRNICNEISNNELLVMNIIHPIVEPDTRYEKLKVPAIELLSKLHLGHIVGSKTMVNHINYLMGSLFNDANECSLRKAAAKALMLLTMERTAYCQTIMDGNTGTKRSVVDELCSMLSAGDRSYRKAIAQLLRQFCLICHTDEARRLLIIPSINSILLEVRKVIYNEVDQAVGTNQPNSQQQPNRSPAEFVLKLCCPCIDTSSFASRCILSPLPCLGGNMGNQQPAPATLQAPLPSFGGDDEHHGMLSIVLRFINKLVNVPGAHYAYRRNSNTTQGGNVQDQPARTVIEPSTRKTLVAVLALAAQICDDGLADAAGDFDSWVPNSEANQFVDRLKKIIEMCTTDSSVALLKGKGPSVDYLMMIKSLTKLCTWLMLNKQEYAACFKEEVDQKLKDAFEAMRGLELAVLLTCRPDEMANYETLSLIAERASTTGLMQRTSTSAQAI